MINFNDFQDNHLDTALSHFYGYQDRAYGHGLVRDANTIPYIDKGLGKSVVSLAYAMKLQAKRVLVICSRNAMNTWRKESIKWCGIPEELIVYIQGTPKKRAELWKKEAAVQIVTYRTNYTDGQKGIARYGHDMVICDESHYARNHKTQNNKGLINLRKQVGSINLPTGSAVSRGPQDLYGLLRLLDPDQHYFSSYYRFINKFCYVIETEWGQEVSGARNVPELKELIAPYIFRARKTDPEVANSLPKKTRIRLDLTMDPKISRVYKELDDTSLYIGDEEITISANKAVNNLRLRQLLCCPQLLDPSLPIGQGFETVLEEIKSDETNQHAVIFVPFRDAAHIFTRALREEGFTVVNFMGGMSPEEMRIAETTFKTEKCIAVNTIQYAQSYDLSTCSYGYFIGKDWDPEINYQAEDRLHRRTSEKPVFIYYTTHLGTVEEDQFERLDSKIDGIEGAGKLMAT